jgi:hypothetical protein
MGYKKQGNFLNVNRKNLLARKKEARRKNPSGGPVPWRGAA